ncbi:inactive beta-amylase 9-like [Wolffia australiana]
MEASVIARQAGAASAEVLMMPARTRAHHLHVPQSMRCPVPASGKHHHHSGAVVAAVQHSNRGHAVVCAAIRSEVAGEAASQTVQKKESPRRLTAERKPQLFVGLPLDAVSDGKNVNHAKAIAAGLKALKLLGVEGVELPIWWGVVEKEAMGQYDWTGYLALAQTIRDAGLQIRPCLYFHACTAPAIPLPPWLTAIADADPDILFTDRAGKRHLGCLSLSVDDLPVLHGKSPLHVYSAFFQSFHSAFSDFLGSSIKDVVVGLGPDGELRYPSQSKGGVTGVGEFQCYDKYLLAQLKAHADETGNPYWGLSGPHDAPRYTESPEATSFFKEHGGSWSSPYGQFFLAWYSGRLVEHGERVLAAACAALPGVAVAGKVPVVHAWSKHRARPAELTAGFQGYEAVAEMLARRGCGAVVGGIELADAAQPAAARASPEAVVGEIVGACARRGVAVAGESAGGKAVFERLKERLRRGGPVGQLTYQRMGAYFFSPEHFPAFTQFVRGLEWAERHPDDMPAGDGETIPLSPRSSAAGNARQMQAA